MSEFCEFRSVGFKVDNTSAAAEKEIKAENPKQPFQETYLKGDSYYNIGYEEWEIRERGNVEQFNDTILAEQNFSPLGQNNGFLAIGGYNLSKLPAAGEQWEDSYGFNIEKRPYLRLRRIKEDTESWVYFDLNNRKVVDLLYGDEIQDAFTQTTIEEVNYLNLNNLQGIYDLSILGESSYDNSILQSIALYSDNINKTSRIDKSLYFYDITSKEYNTDTQKLSITIAISYKNSNKKYTGSINIIGDLSEKPTQLIASFEKGSLAEITLQAGVTPLTYYLEYTFDISWNNLIPLSFLQENSYNILTEIPEYPEKLLDIPNSIIQNTIQGVRLPNTTTVNQTIIPVNDYFFLGKGTFGTSLRAIRTYPLKNYIIEDEGTKYDNKEEIEDNIFILTKDSLKQTQIKTLENIVNNYDTIYYGRNCLSDTKVKNFTIKNTDVYPYNNINFAVEDTPYLDNFIGTINGYTDNLGFLKNSNNVKSCSSGAIRDLLNNNVLSIKSIKDKIGTNITLEDYCFLSPKNSIHHIVIDGIKENDSEEITYSENSLNFGENSQLETLTINTDFSDNINQLNLQFSPTQAKLIINNTYFSNYSKIDKNSFTDIYIKKLNTNNFSLTNSIKTLNNLKIDESTEVGNPPAPLSIDIENCNLNTLTLSKNGLVRGQAKVINTLNLEESEISVTQLCIFAHANTSIQNLVINSKILQNGDSNWHEQFPNLQSLILYNTYKDNNETYSYQLPNIDFALKMPFLTTITILGIEGNIFNTNTTFKNLQNLKEVHIYEDLVANNNIPEQCFYSTHPIEVFIHLNRNIQFPEGKITLAQLANLLGWDETNNSFGTNGENNIFPNGSKINLVNQDGSSKFIDTYSKTLMLSKTISTMENFTYQQLENNGKYINDDSIGGGNQ